MKTYNAPSLTTYGDVETITQGSGNRTTRDLNFFNGSPVRGGDGGGGGGGGGRDRDRGGSSDIRQ